MSMERERELKRCMAPAEGFLGRARELLAAQLGGTGFARVDEVLRYPLEAPGHGLRPWFAWLAAHAAGSDEARCPSLVTFAAAVELIHQASLLHDDLLDGEHVRRGRPCLHRAHGDRAALLAGNVHYIGAFRLAVTDLDVACFQAMIDATTEMCEGELLQDALRDVAMSTDEYMGVIRRKTGALMRLAFGEGARLAGAPEAVVSTLAELGLAVGLLYQLADDRQDGDANVEPDFDVRAHMRELAARVEALAAIVPVPAALEPLLRFVRLMDG